MSNQFVNTNQYSGERNFESNKFSSESNTSSYADLKNAVLVGNLEQVVELFDPENFEKQDLLDDKTGDSLIHLAVNSKQLSVVRYLIERNLSVNKTNKNGETPLHLAANLGTLKIVEYLIGNGAILAPVDQNGNTPLHLACIENNFKVAMALCSAGHPLDQRNKNRRTPLLCAVANSSVNCVRILLKAGARPDVTEEGGNSTLHVACIRGDYAVVRILCKAISDIDILNASEYTPLQLAAKYGYIKTVRYLILAGADPSTTNRNGIAPDVMAFAQGHWKVGMLLTKMKPERRKLWIDQLKEDTHCLPRIKVKLLGSSLVGKTQLIQSLKIGPISAYLRKKITYVSEFAGLNGESAYSCQYARHNSPYQWNVDSEHENCTQGISVHTTNDYSFWDFSGYQSYYCVYDNFIGDLSCVHIILFSLLDSPSWRRSSVRFWLDFLYSRIPISGPILFGGKPNQMAHIVLVATHADCIQCGRDSSGFYYDEDTISLIKEMIKEYEDKLDIHEIVYVLDSRDAASVEIKQLKNYLADLRTLLIQTLPRTNSLLIEVCNKLSEWTQDDSFPVYNLDQFAEKIHEHVNPLCTEEHLTSLIQHLQYTGNIIYIESQSCGDMIVLDPNWFCMEVIGKCLSEKAMHHSRITGSFTLDDLQLFIRNENTIRLVQILESYGLCVCCVVKERNKKIKHCKKDSANYFEMFEQASGSNHHNLNDKHFMNHITISQTYVIKIDELNQFINYEDIQIEIPRLNLIPMYKSLWDPTDITMKYVGLELNSFPGQFIHLMPRIQTELRRVISTPQFSDTDDSHSNFVFNDAKTNNCNPLSKSQPNGQLKLNIFNWELVQWLHGSKISDNKGEVQLLIKTDSNKQTLILLARCLPRLIRRTFHLLHDTLQLINKMINVSCPNLFITVNIFHSDDLEKHLNLPNVWDTNKLIQTLITLFSKNDLQNKITYPYVNVLNQSIKLNNLQNENNLQERTELELLLMKDLFFNDEQLLNHVIQSLEYPTTQFSISLLKHMAKLLDLVRRDENSFLTLSQYLCYPDLQTLNNQWRQGITLNENTLSPSIDLLQFANKFSIKILEWALLSIYDLDIMKPIYLSHILLNLNKNQTSRTHSFHGLFNFNSNKSARSFSISHDSQ